VLDAQLISAAIADRKAWDKIADHFTEKELSPQGGFWWPIVRQWYERDPTAPRISRELLQQQGEVRITNPKHRETLLGFIAGLPAADSPENIVQVALELKRHNVGMELAAAISNNDREEVAELLPRFTDLQQATALAGKRRAEVRYAVGFRNLRAKIGKENRVPLAPDSLNAKISGGALPGHHVLIFGRPEAGKSTFALNMAASLVYRGQRVLYLGNEDQIDVLEGRMMLRLCNMTQAEVDANYEAACQRAERRAGDRLVMAQLSDGGINEVRELVELHKPNVLVIDQIRNLTSDADSLTKALERNAQDLRRLLLEYNLIGISVSQAGDRSSGYGQQPPVWLGLGDVDSSRTGLPAQCDLMLGIGSDAELASRNQRAISLPKNKLSSDPDAHVGFIVELDRARCKVT
jgi:KaiC/GvpD/RAD55 family RecA-like ATPase